MRDVTKTWMPFRPAEHRRLVTRGRRTAMSTQLRSPVLPLGTSTGTLTKNVSGNSRRPKRRELKSKSKHYLEPGS